MTIKRSSVPEEKAMTNGVGKAVSKIAIPEEKAMTNGVGKTVSKIAIPAGFESVNGTASPVSTTTASPVTAVLRMEGGGDASYVKFSSGQANINAELRPMLADAIRKFSNFPASGPICVVDLGCSVGANALGFAECITKAVREKCKALSRPCREVQYFFSDLPSNDFNNLFLSLAPLLCGGDLEDLKVGNGHVQPEARNYFAAAVPGSFYDRLFPEESLHVVMSAWSMHWLSHIPDSVTDKSSPSYNKGKVWINEGNPLVAEEYSKVSKENLKSFFTYRGMELVSGGLLFVMMMSRKDPDRKEIQFGQPLGTSSPISGMFELAWNDLVAEGIIDEETRDSFNMPIYCPSADEIQEAIDETSAFSIKKMEIWEDIDFLPREMAAQLVMDPEKWGAMAMNMAKTMMLTLVEAHVGPDIAAILWDRLEKQVVNHCRRTKTVFCGNSPGCNVALAVLVRN